MSGYKRCPTCTIAPLPWDVPYFWGNTSQEQAIDECLACRGEEYRPSLRRREDMPMMINNGDGKPRGRAVVVLVDKFEGMPARLLDEHLLGNVLRDALKFREYGTDTFLTDGDRLWRWKHFPLNKESPLSWDHFLMMWPEWDLYEPTDKGIVIIEEAPDDEEEPTTLEAVVTETERVPVVICTPFDHIKTT